MYQGGILRIEGEWSYDAGPRTVDIDLRQVQAAVGPYEMPIQVGIYYEGELRPQLEVVRISDRRNRFSLRADVEPVAVVLDPNTWVLMEAQLERR